MATRVCCTITDVECVEMTSAEVMTMLIDDGAVCTPVTARVGDDARQAAGHSV